MRWQSIDFCITILPYIGVTTIEAKFSPKNFWLIYFSWAFDNTLVLFSFSFFYFSARILSATRESWHYFKSISGLFQLFKWLTYSKLLKAFSERTSAAKLLTCVISIALPPWMKKKSDRLFQKLEQLKVLEMIPVGIAIRNIFWK